jgi:hypothetical protein
MIFIGMINDEVKQKAWFGHWFIFPLSAFSHRITIVILKRGITDYILISGR